MRHRLLRASATALLLALGSSAAAFAVPLPTVPSWTATGPAELTWLGSYVASAGDVNGDGFSDVIVAGIGQDGFTPALALLFEGSPAGLQTSPAWSLVQGLDGPQNIGGVAGAGDVNGDGYADVLVSRPYPYPSHVDLYLGSSAGLQHGPAWTAYGETSDEFFYASIASARDVNGDGYADVIIGAPGPVWTRGRAYLYLGGAIGLAPLPSLTFEVNGNDSHFGASLAAGDVNHDGYGDLIIGAPGYDIGSEFNQGKAFLFLGGPLGPSTTPAWTAEGSLDNELFASLLAVGDVDADGYPDVAVASQDWHPPSNNEVNDVGRVQLFRGGPGGLAAAPSWSHEGEQDEENTGSGLAMADVDGDGHADLVVGSGGYFNEQTNSGRLQLFMGSAAGLSSTPAWEVHDGNIQYYSYYGNALASAGDVNADGAQDIVGGALRFALNRGQAYLYLGDPPVKVLDPLCLDTGSCLGKYVVSANGSFEVDPDPNHLAPANVARIGAVTDGVTELLLRVETPAPQTQVTFTLRAGDGTAADASLGGLMPVEGGTPASTVTVSSTAIPTGENIAFARYRAPLDYPAGLNVTVVPQSPSLRIEAVTPERTSSRPLVLAPPPFVLVHGVWSGPDTWLGPGGGLYGELLGRGFFTCSECLVNYGSSSQPSSLLPKDSFDPEAPDDKQVAVSRLIAAVDKVRNEVRRRGLAVTQVDVIGHSEGGLVARSRIKTSLFHYRWEGNLGAGDFHKIITLGTPHLGTKLADWFLVHKCEDLSLLGANVMTLETLFAKIHKPIGPAILGFQTESEPVEHLGETTVPTHPIVGVEGPTDSLVKRVLDFILARAPSPTTIDTQLNGTGLVHDTIVRHNSQRGGSTVNSVAIEGIVHAGIACSDTAGIVSCKDIGISETASATVWNEIARLLLAPVSSPVAQFGPIPAYVRPGLTLPLTLHSCTVPFEPAAPIRSNAAVTLGPAPGTVVLPGAQVTVSLSIAGGNPVDGTLFILDGQLYLFDGPGPFVFTYLVPDDRAGAVTIEAHTFGPGPENYSATTSLVVQPTAPLVSLAIHPATLTLSQPAETASLQVIGNYADGTMLDLTAPGAGTTYTVLSGTGAVVTVGADGVVTAVNDGDDVVVAHQGALSASLPVSVRIANHRPLFAPPATLSIEAEQPFDLPLVATDPDGNAVAFETSPLPAFASILNQSPGSGVLQLRPGVGDVGTYSLYVAAVDDGRPPLGSGATIALTVRPPCPQAPVGGNTLSVSMTGLSWTPLAGAASYDVVYGDQASFWITGDYQDSLIGCLASDTGATTLAFTTAPPAPAGGFWFLVRGRACGGPGSWDDGVPGQTDTRDYLNASPLACP